MCRYVLINGFCSPPLLLTFLPLSLALASLSNQICVYHLTRLYYFVCLRIHLILFLKFLLQSNPLILMIHLTN